jgi:hypothetical protein
MAEARAAGDQQQGAAAQRHRLVWGVSCGLALGLLGVPSGVAGAWRSPEKGRSLTRGARWKEILLKSYGSKPDE